MPVNNEAHIHGQGCHAALTYHSLKPDPRDRNSKCCSASFYIVKLNCFTVLTKLVVGLGTYNLDNVEVVNLDEPGQICAELQTYPFEVQAATGQLINGLIPMICGGVTETKEFYNRCECFGLVNGSWAEVGLL